MKLRTVDLTQTQTPVLNPLKGWVAYGRSADDFQGEIDKYYSTAFARFMWNVIEPEEGEYHWEVIDDVIGSFARAGKQTGIGVLPTNSCDHVTKYLTPKYVFDAGAGYEVVRVFDNQKREYVDQITPYYDDPIFLEKLDQFLAAYAAKYDGHPDVAFIDVRSLGNWGEGHSMLWHNPENRYKMMAKHYDMHLKHFKKTPLIIPWGEPQYHDVCIEYTQKGMGIRRDGVLGNSDSNEILPAMGKGPSMIEFWGPYKMMKEYGWWYGKDFTEFGDELCHMSPDEHQRWWDEKIFLKKTGENTLDTDIMIGRPSFVGMGHTPACAKAMLHEERELMDKWANKLGYNFVLVTAQYSEEATDCVTVNLMWRNDAYSMLCRSAYQVIALVDEEGIPRFAQRYEQFDFKKIWPRNFKELMVNIPTGSLPRGVYTIKIGIMKADMPVPQAGEPLPKAWIQPAVDEIDENKWIVLGTTTLI